MVQIAQLHEHLTDPLRRVLSQVLEYLPNIIGAIVLVLVGWVVASLLRVLCRRLAQSGLRRLERTAWWEARAQQGAFYRSLSSMAGTLVFWIVMLLFLGAGIEALGLPAVSNILAAVTIYLPRVLVATLILFGGVLLGELARTWTAGMASRAGVAFADLVGRTAQGVVLVVSILIAIDQVGIDSTAILIAMGIAVGSVFGATALAFGLGARGTVSNIIAVHYVYKAYRVGDKIRIGDLEGPIARITRTAVMLRTEEGLVLVPARQFSEQVSVLLTGESGSGD